MRLFPSQDTSTKKPQAGVDYRLIYPLRPLWAGFLANTAFYVAALWLLTLGPVQLRRLIRCHRGQCLRCGYDLHGSEHERCPECGVALTNIQRNDPRSRGAPASTMMTSGALGITMMLCGCRGPDQHAYSRRVLWTDASFAFVGGAPPMLVDVAKGNASIFEIRNGYYRGRKSTAHSSHTAVYLLAADRPRAGEHLRFSHY